MKFIAAQNVRYTHRRKLYRVSDVFEEGYNELSNEAINLTQTRIALKTLNIALRYEMFAYHKINVLYKNIMQRQKCEKYKFTIFNHKDLAILKTWRL